jgi:hypothetical protein
MMLRADVKLENVVSVCSAAAGVESNVPPRVVKAFCIACAHDVLGSESTLVATGLDKTHVIHAACQRVVLAPGIVRRAEQLRSFTHATARKVAIALRVKVTRDGRYMEHAEVCARAACASADEPRWLSAVGLATGKGVSAAATAPSSALGGDEIAQIVAAAVAAAAEGIEARVAEVAEAAAAKIAGPRRIEVVVNKSEPRDVGTAHRQFPRLLKMLSAGVNVWLAGPAGSGKTTAAEQAAKALGLAFYFNGAIDTEYKLSGFVDAQGRVVSTAFRRAYADGGVYLFDEVDASLPSAVLAFNAALANGHADFPGCDQPVARHPDFRCVAAGNTWGLGATSEYVGRCKMDAAFLDRFCQLTWDYDEDLERGLATTAAWCSKIQALRAKAKARGLKIVVSPRATINGCKLLAAGMTVDEALDATVRAKISATDWSNLNV